MNDGNVSAVFCLPVSPSLLEPRELLLTCEYTAGMDVNIKYALFTDQTGKWRVMAVPMSPESFACRKALPEAWRGIRDEKVIIPIRRCDLCLC